MSLSDNDKARIDSEVLGRTQSFFDDWLGRDPASFDRIEDYFGDGFFGIGTGKDEYVDSKKEWVDGLRQEWAEIEAGFNYEILETHFRTYDLRTCVVLIEFTIQPVEMPDQAPSHARVSLVYRKEQKVWRMVHGYASIPWDAQAEGETFPMDELKARAERLEKEVEERTASLSRANRDLEVEASLERIRRVTSEMKDPSDLIEVVKQIRLEVDALYGDKAIEVGLMQEADEETFRFWSILDPNEVPEDLALFGLLYPKKPNPPHPMLDRVWSSEGAYSLLYFDLEELWKIIASLERYSPEEAKMMRVVLESGEINGGWQTVSSIQVGRMYMGWFEEPPEDVAIVQPRIAAVLSEAQKKVEELRVAQRMAREAEINLAVEKVRTRASGMQASQEIVDVADVLRGQLVELGLKDVLACTVYTKTPDGKHRVAEMARLAEGSEEHSFDWIFDPADLDPKIMVHDFLAANEASVFHQDAEAMALLMKEAMKFDSDYTEEYQEAIDQSQISEVWVAVCPSESVRLSIDFKTEPPEEILTILPRMAAAFDLAYRRFEDLKQAEAQTREALIEAALERVRGRALAMRSSQELLDVSLEMRRQMGLLGQKDLEVCAIHLYEVDDDMFESWGAMRMPGTEEEIMTGTSRLPKKGVLVMEESIDKYHSDETEYVIINEGEKAAGFMRMMEEYSPQVYQALKGLMMDGNAPEKAYWSFADFSGGSMLVVTYEPAADDSRNLLRRCAKVFDLAFRRFLDLKEAEEAEREAHIETALERVRSRSMAMKSSDELMDVAQVLFQQLIALGMDPDIFETCGFVIFREGTKIGDTFLTQLDGSPLAYTFSAEYGGDRATREHYAAWEEAKSIEMVHLVGEQLPEHLTYLAEQSGKPVDRFHEIAGKEVPPESFNYSANFKHGYVAVITTVPMEEAEALYPRFAKVFEQAYTRFLDLKKAEAQTREAQIEASLERVRARTMAMQHSEELEQVSIAYSEQLTELGMNNDAAMFLMNDPEEDSWTLWSGYSTVHPTERVRGKSFKIELPEVEQDPTIDAWRRGGTHRETFIPKEDLPAWVETYQSIWDITGQTAEEIIAILPDGYHRIDAFFKHGLFAAGRAYQFTEEETQIQIRFAKEFERSYQRFLDLKKAEAQARESQIEAALERLRSRTMAMTSSEELLDVSSVMTQQLVELGIEIHWAYLYRYNEDVDELETYLTKSTIHPVEVAKGKSGLWAYPRSFHDPGQGQDEFLESWKKREAFRVANWERDRFDEWADQFQMMFDDLGYSREDYRPHVPEGIFNIEALMGAGYVGMGGAGAFSRAETDVLVRFANEFEGTYRRFLDIQKAEAQARESQIEAALERIRSRAMAMTTSNELLEVVLTIHREFAGLDLECGVFWHAKYTPEGYEKALTGVGGQRVTTIMELPRGFSMVPELAKWERGTEKLGVFKFNADAAVQYLNHMIEKGNFLEVDPNAITEEAVRENLGWTFVQARTTHGEIGYTLWGETDPSNEATDVLIRFAGAFDLAYTRFVDIQKAEEDLVRLKEEKARTEQALTVLQATQKQLIEQEKLASLGSLTAGIAHEIKNPLNFVNNFAEVSTELMEELAEAIATANVEEAATLLADLRENAIQITKHGKRADSIVRSMMQHARGGASDQEVIVVNEFLEEYGNLAWHGMRARDHGFSAELLRDFDPKAGSLTVMPQELGRVVLNLLNNAFDAVKEVDAGEVTMRSARTEEGLIISVSDNGPGIPDAIRDKIFEPFFTTKATGEGTGLGLSLSYDIITKGHGGTMEVGKSKTGGAEFTVILPGGSE